MQRASIWQTKLRKNFCVYGVVLLAHTGLISSIYAADSSTVSSDQLQKEATWKWADVALIEQHLASYLDQVQASSDVRTKVLELWKSKATEDKGPLLLERILAVAGIVDPRIADLVARFNDPAAAPTMIKDLTWLSSDVPAWLQDTVRLAAGRSLAQRRLYDEALETLAGLELKQVCDPASLVFYRAVCQHHLLKKKECVANVELLLERQSELPVRFTQVAQLLSADIKPLKDDSLDEVARLMNDVQRRLDLGRAGKQVRDEEKDIIDKLEKMIEKMEEAQKQQSQSQQQANGEQQKSQQGQSQPMDESRLAGGPTGSGDVNQKDIGRRDGWGNLPPAERQASLQRLTQELPSHYREVIEGYFRQLAKEKK